MVEYVFGKQYLQLMYRKTCLNIWKDGGTFTHSEMNVSTGDVRVYQLLLSNHKEKPDGVLGRKIHNKIT